MQTPDNDRSSGFSLEFRDRIRTYCQTRSYVSGTVLREQGHHYNALYLINRGGAEVKITSPANHVTRVNLTDGDLVGEIGFLHGCPATATVTATTPVEVLVVDDATVSLVEQKEPQLAVDLLRHFATVAEERMSANTLLASTLQEDADNETQILLCRDKEMLHRAQRLRYDVYCDELGRSSPNADHDQRVIADALDETALVFIAVENGETVGTVRGNISREGNLGVLEQLYGMSASPNHPEATGITTKFIVRKSRRGSTLSMQLVAALTRHGMRAGVKESYMDSVPGLLPYYKAMGFRISAEKFYHRENGLSYPMVIDLTKHGPRLSEMQGSAGLIKMFVTAKLIKWRDGAYRRVFGGDTD